MAATQPTIVVLGGARSIGGQCARTFTKAGWNCFIGDGDGRALAALEEELERHFGYYKGDVTSRLGLRNVQSGAMAMFPTIDAVVHIPEIPDAKTFYECSSDNFEETIIAPARSVTAAMHIFSDQMIEQQKGETNPGQRRQAGCFVQIFSMGAEYGDPDKYSQNVAQSMALAAAKSAALDLSKYKIRTNAIVSVRPRAESEEGEWLTSRTPMGRPTHADEISASVHFLCNSATANMTGQIIRLDGGRSILNGVMPKDD